MKQTVSCKVDSTSSTRTSLVGEYRLYLITGLDCVDWMLD